MKTLDLALLSACARWKRHTPAAPAAASKSRWRHPPPRPTAWTR